METAWRSYEEVAAYLLEQNADKVGLLKVEGKQKIRGCRSGTRYEIDAKGIRKGNEGFVIIECRRYTTSQQKQENLAALAYKIIDTGAVGAIIVSPLGIQEGAAKIAASEGILNVQLDANCTPAEFAMRFLNELMIGIRDGLTFGDRPSIQVFTKCRSCGEGFRVVENEIMCPDCRAKSPQV